MTLTMREAPEDVQAVARVLQRHGYNYRDQGVRVCGWATHLLRDPTWLPSSVVVKAEAFTKAAEEAERWRLWKTINCEHQEWGEPETLHGYTYRPCASCGTRRVTPERPVCRCPAFGPSPHEPHKYSFGGA